MKRCPQCNRVETDDALGFCRADGAALAVDPSTLNAERRTAKLSGSFVASESAATRILPSQTTAAHGSRFHYVVNGIRRHQAVALFALIVIFVASVGVAYAIYQLALQSKPQITHFHKMTIKRVTAEGNVESATISPDGKYIAYSLEESGRRSVWTKH